MWLTSAQLHLMPEAWIRCTTSPIPWSGCLWTMTSRFQKVRSWVILFSSAILPLDRCFGVNTHLYLAEKWVFFVEYFAQKKTSTSDWVGGVDCSCWVRRKFRLRVIGKCFSFTRLFCALWLGSGYWKYVFLGRWLSGFLTERSNFALNYAVFMR